MKRSSPPNSEQQSPLQRSSSHSPSALSTHHDVSYQARGRYCYRGGHRSIQHRYRQANAYRDGDGRSRHRYGLLSQINVVPYIDVMLVLLVIFMITAPLLKQGIPIHLPTANGKRLHATDTHPLIVTINANGQYYLNAEHRPLSSQRLFNTLIAQREWALKQDHSLPPVYVNGDQSVTYGQVVRAIGLIRDSGFRDVNLVTRSRSRS